jgi:two-component system cell cycle sensor histidine kinase/response regulator CckA
MMGETMISENMSGDTTSGDTMVGAALAVPGLWGGRETILLVEDEAFVRKVTAEVLESAGYRLVIAGSATEALKACGGCFRPLDLVFADVVMPGMNGRELAVELTSLYPSARVLLMSGCAQQLGGGELSCYGEEYLAKPFSIRTLLSRVREVLDKPADCEGRAKPRSFYGSA